VCVGSTVRRLGLLCCLGVALTALLTVPGEPPAAARSTVEQPCGWRTQPPATYDHVIWVFFENRSYGDLIGPAGSRERRRAPYLNTLARRCGLATDYWGITHPSLPNYLAAVSGATGGVERSCTPRQCPQRRRTLFQQLTARQLTWRVYAESMPTRCRRTDAYPYVVRHNPAAYFPWIARDCARWAVPMGTPRHGRFADHLAEGRLPSLSVVIPNQCHNTHDCRIATGDAWLSRLMAEILRSPDYRAGSTAVFLTYDEGAGGSPGRNCRTKPARSCHIVTVVVSPSTVIGMRSGRRFDHYSLLRTTEGLFGIETLLRHAGDARTRDMRSAFGL
jgi:phosphatidylinositol-3-phosphatase